jgi:hypothetical protein
VRAQRPQPGRDDKVVTAWNALAITALLETSVALEKPEYAAAAIDCARRLLVVQLVDGRLRRASLGGVAGDSAGILEDYATLATALCGLYQLTGTPSWLTVATGLIDTALEHFADPERPGHWFDTADDTEALVLRPADPLDGPPPPGVAMPRRCIGRAPQRDPRYPGSRRCHAAAAGTVLAKAPRSGGIARRRRGGGARTHPDRGRLRSVGLGVADGGAPPRPGGAWS